MTNRTAIVTGASRGIGLEVARQLVAKGWQVAIIARGEKSLKTAAEYIGSDKVLPISCDVGDPKAVRDVVKAVEDKFGPVSALVNNAGIIDPIGNLHELDAAERDNLLTINISGVMNFTQAVIPSMLAAGEGVIVNLSSGAALNPNAGWSAYCTSKAAVHMYTRCIDIEYASKGIRARSFIPGVVGTDMLNGAQTKFDNPVAHIPDENKLTPDIPARCIVWLIEHSEAGDKVDQSIRDPELRAKVGLEERAQW